MSEGRKLRVGIAGMTSDHVWGMGDGLAALPEVEMVAGAEPYPELRERAAQQWKLQRTYADFREMLEREPLDALMLCGDNAGKAAIVEAAAQRKIHVYQDKPMAATLAQADRSLRAAESSGITLMVAYHSAFNPIYDDVKRLIQSGAIGNIYLARGATGHAGPVEFGCSKYFCEWLFDRQRNGGGTFIDEACYLVDGFVDLLGGVTEVSAFTAQIGYRDYLPQDVEDNAVAILRFANGALGVIDSKWGQIGPAPVRTSYHGAQGTITTGPAGTELYSTLDPTVPKGWEPIELPAQRSRSIPNLRGWRAPSAGTPSAGRGGLEQRLFVERALERRPIEGAASPKVARDAQEVIEAVYRSAERGCAVKLPLE